VKDNTLGGDEMKGQTFLANIYDVSPELLSSDEVIRLLLIRCVEAVEMTPVLHTYQSSHFPAPIDGELRGGYGISAGMILVESHIYIHTWPESKFARFELSSCKPFTIDNLLKTIRVIFGEKIKMKYCSIDWDADYSGSFYCQRT